MKRDDPLHSADRADQRSKVIPTETERGIRGGYVSRENERGEGWCIMDIEQETQTQRAAALVVVRKRLSGRERVRTTRAAASARTDAC